jgi:putative sulfotransferase
LLSDLIAEEPQTLSVQESLISRSLERWSSDEKITGREYWSLLCTPSRQWETIVRIGAIAGEMRYPATGRWGRNLAKLPAIAIVTLPALSDDPDTLFDLLDAQVPDFPAQAVAQHHVMFLDFLASLRQRRRWVERSGGSSALADPLLGKIHFDQVVYLTRGTAATAASMSRHSNFQFAAIRTALLFQCGFDPYNEPAPLPERPGGGGERGRPVPADLQCLLPEQLTRATLAERGGPVEQHKLVLAGMSYTAEVALAKYPPQQLLRMRYEDLVAAPEEQLTGLGEFLGFADPEGWAIRAADRVRDSGRPGPAVQRAVHSPGNRGG